MPPGQSTSTQVEVLFCMGSSLYVLDADRLREAGLKGPFTHVSVSPGGRYVGLFTKTGTLLVASTRDYSKCIASFNTNSTSAPADIAWCCEEDLVVALHWPDILLVIAGPAGNWLKYSYEGSLLLVSELDGARVISKKCCDFIQLVPAPCVDVFRYGSTAPGAILYDAFDHFSRQSPKADENIRQIRSDLLHAVESCIHGMPST